MTTIGLTAANVPIRIDPGDALSIPITVPAGYETGTWAAAVYSSSALGTPLVSFTVGTFTGQSTTISLTSANVTSLLSSSSTRFTGWWQLTRTSASAQRTWVAGDFVIDAARQSPSTVVGALTLAISNGVITAS